MNKLYYGDNLDVLRRHIKDESVDLIYLDPPFKSDQNYNVLFAERDGQRSAAQVRAFEDTWRWDQAAAEAFHEITCEGGHVAPIMQAFRQALGENDMLAYLSMMAPRLIELHRVLKPTGSIYLHCDPAASHYLKMLMDAAFGPTNFRSEIIWKRRSGHSSGVHTSNRFGLTTDSVLFYAKTEQNTFRQPFSLIKAKDYIEQRFIYDDGDGRKYRRSPLNNPADRPNLKYEYKGYKPPPKGWAVSLDVMKRMDKEGRLYFPPDKSQRIQRKMFLDEYKGQPIQNLWDDVPFINPVAKERLGYPTQKPEALLDRIIQASSNEGDVVLDPFCGCGTAIASAERLNRSWIGIDITHLAMSLIKHRLTTSFADVKYKVIGEPVSPPDAERLAKTDPWQFQWWALGLVGARPTEQKKGADQGIDGRLFFHDGPEAKQTEQIIFSVKAGKTGSPHVRDLRGVIARENAAIGVLLTFQPPTKAMTKEAASAGFYECPWGRFPKMQIYTVKQLLEAAKPNFPPTGDQRTLKSSPRKKRADDRQKSFLKKAG